MADVAVLGGGPAGLAASIVLREGGLSVVIIDRPKGKYQHRGESLAPAARRSLMKLGLWSLFLKDEHPPSYGNRSAWGSDRLDQYSYIQSADGHAWHIDRALFDKRLLDKAVSAGVDIIKSTKNQLAKSKEGSWEITSTQLDKPICADIIIDATGRASWAGRQLGVKRMYLDRQVAVVAFLKTDGTPLEDTSSLVEAVEDGWWYAAAQPDGRLACVFFTDPDIQDVKALSANMEDWNDQLSKSRHTKDMVEKHGYQLESIPYVTSANTSLLATPMGDRWIAVGDAAMSYDPLSAHGLSLALITGIDGAAAVLGQYEEDSEPLEDYTSKLQKAFLHYTEERFKYYLQEQRWSDAPYWRRRHNEHKQIAFLESLIWDL